ncbi:MAG: hypothetical protein J5793_03805, partial [Clostridia bacterium]|nr:hypothetical protein [Clostridia bacterium]
GERAQRRYREQQREKRGNYLLPFHRSTPFVSVGGSYFSAGVRLQIDYTLIETNYQRLFTGNY